MSDMQSIINQRAAALAGSLSSMILWAIVMAAIMTTDADPKGKVVGAVFVMMVLGSSAYLFFWSLLHAIDDFLWQPAEGLPEIEAEHEVAAAKPSESGNVG